LPDNDYWPLGRALAWISWRDPAAHPWLRDVAAGAPYGWPRPWDDLATPDVMSYIRVAATVLGDDADVGWRMVPLNTRRDGEVFQLLAAQCAAGAVRAIGRTADGRMRDIHRQEWRGPTGLSDQWCEVWVHRVDLLLAFPDPRATVGTAIDDAAPHPAGDVAKLHYGQKGPAVLRDFEEHYGELWPLPSWNARAEVIADRIGCSLSTVVKTLRDKLTRDIRTGRKKPPFGFFK
jgi:hypothetical protein